MLFGTRRLSADATYRQLFGLDELGNWQDFDQDDTGDGSTAWTYETARTHNTANEITAITATTGGAWSDPAYDAAGNMTKASSINAATDQPQMVYDAWNRLFCVTSSTTTNPNGPDILADYQYDARHFRISRGGYSGRSNIERTHYYYTSSWQCIEETKQVAQSGWTPANIVLLPAELSAQYVWGLRYIDDLVQRQRDTTGNGTLDETLYALNDRQFNVAALTNTSGAVQQRFVTTPYGQTDYLTAAYASSTDLYDWQFVFQGLRKDPDTPFIYNRYRDLDTLLGRFLQTEPLGYTDGMNRYAAYHVMWGGLDPMGLNQENTDVLSVEHEFSKWKSTLDAKTNMFDKYQLGSPEHEFGKIMWVQAKVKMTTAAIAAAGKTSWSLVKKLPKLHPALRPFVWVTDIAIAASEGEEAFLREIGEQAVDALLKEPKAAWKEILDRVGLGDVEEFRDHVTKIASHASKPHTVTRKHKVHFTKHDSHFESPTDQRDCLRDWYSMSLSYDSSTRHDFHLFMMGEYCWEKEECCYSCTLSVKGYEPDLTVRCAKTKSKCK